MADKSLHRDYFAILREKQEIEGGKEVKPLGFFSCRASTTRYLDLTTKVASGLITFTRKASTKKRSLMLADGTTLTASAADKAEGGEPEASIGTKSFSKGCKPIRLITGKRINETDTTNFGISNRHSISFRFPQFVTIAMISNALGALLNPGTVEATPGDGQIFPFFISPGGKRYPIATVTAAKENTTVAIAISEAGLLTLAELAGTGIVIEPVQGTTPGT